MSWLDAHTQSEQLSAQAEGLVRAGNRADSLICFAQAAEAEERAFRLVATNKPRTLGIMAVSAASLYLKAGEYAGTERVAVEAMAQNSLPPFARQQLRLLLQDTWFEQQKAASTVDFLPNQVHVAVRGGNILHGAAPLDLVVDKVKSIQSIFYRTIEHMRGLPLRRRGSPKQDIVDSCRPWLVQTLPGSYQFAVAVQRPTQSDFFKAEIDPEGVVQDFLNIIRAGTSEDPLALEQLVPQADYRDAFVKLTNQLAPKLKNREFDSIEVRGIGEQNGIVLGPETRNILKKRMITNIDQQIGGISSEPETISGILRGLHLDQDWIEIIDGLVVTKISGIRDTLEDVIGPMTNRRVVATVVRSPKQSAKLLDIDLE